MCFTNTSSFELSVTKEQWATLKNALYVIYLPQRGNGIKVQNFFRSGQMNIFVVLQMGEFGV